MKTENIVFRSGIVRTILIHLHSRSDRGDYILRMSRVIKVACGDVLKKLKTLNEIGLIERFPKEKDTKRKYFKLTNTGKDITKHLLLIDNILNNIKNEKI